MPTPDPFNESDAMSDAQLDELLDLATPELDPVRQSALRRTVVQTLKKNRPAVWWFPFQNRYWTTASGVSSRMLVAAVCLAVAVGLGWLVLSECKDDAVNTVATTTSTQNTKPRTIVKPRLSGAELAKMFPPIISSRAGAKKKKPSVGGMVRNANVAQPDASRVVTYSKADLRRLSGNLSSKIESALLQLGGSNVGLKVADQLASQWDAASAEMDGIQDSFRGASRRSLRSAQGRDLLRRQAELKQMVSVRKDFESYLSESIQRLPVESATSAYRLLCRCGTESSLPTVLKYQNNEATQPDTVLAIGRLADSEMLGRMILETQDSALQSKLMAGLLCRHDQDSLDLFLELTAEHDLYAAAQKSGGLAHCVPTEFLMQRLRSNRNSIARAAAITMSSMNEPGITEYLMQLANRPETQRSAVMALTARTDVPAIQFVQLAANDVRWSATVFNEQKKWNRILAVN